MRGRGGREQRQQDRGGSDAQPIMQVAQLPPGPRSARLFARMASPSLLDVDTPATAPSAFDSSITAGAMHVRSQWL